jgi:hypothetical protein
MQSLREVRCVWLREQQKLVYSNLGLRYFGDLLAFDSKIGCFIGMGAGVGGLAI